MNLFSQFFGGGDAPQQDAKLVKDRLGKQNKPYLLDVRQPEEFREGHISGAHLIPLSELERRLKEVPREREIVCVCRSGNRSNVATRQLVQAGYKAVNMRGGMRAWSRSGYAVKKGNS